MCRSFCVVEIFSECCSNCAGIISQFELHRRHCISIKEEGSSPLSQTLCQSFSLQGLLQKIFCVKNLSWGIFWPETHWTLRKRGWSLAKSKDPKTTRALIRVEVALSHSKRASYIWGGGVRGPASTTATTATTTTAMRLNKLPLLLAARPKNSDWLAFTFVDLEIYSIQRNRTWNKTRNVLYWKWPTYVIWASSLGGSSLQSCTGIEYHTELNSKL